MKKTYAVPELFVDEYVADTMIASAGNTGDIVVPPTDLPTIEDKDDNDLPFGV